MHHSSREEMSKALNAPQFPMVKASVFLQCREVALLFLSSESIRKGLKLKWSFNTVSTAKSEESKPQHKFMFRKIHIITKRVSAVQVQGPCFPLMYCPGKDYLLIFTDISTFGCCCLSAFCSLGQDMIST